MHNAVMAQTTVERQQKLQEASRDLKNGMIGEGVNFYLRGKLEGLPKVKNLARKKKCSKSLELFATTYFPGMFPMKMSKGQSDDLLTMQKAIRCGGRFAFAAPRGDGKTTRTEVAIFWAMLYGYRKCIGIVGADLLAAQDILESIKMELRDNEILRDDFPMPCWAANMGDDKALKVKALHYAGRKLNMSWSKGKLQLPFGKEFDGSGCILFARGITGRLRGSRFKVGNKAARPDLFAVDDPQTDESAKSPEQCRTRVKLLLGAVMGSGGPGETIACMMPCTIIEKDDMAYQMLDRKQHPDWKGSVRGLILTWPKAQKTKWVKYMTLRKEESEKAANEYYADNHATMHEGSVVDWEERYIPANETSALQHAQNLLCDLGEEVYFAEYQNEPRDEHLSVFDISPKIVLSRIQRRDELDVPAGASIVTAFTDINDYGLHWAVTGFANDQTGWIASYGRTTGPKGRVIVPKNSTEPVRKRALYEALVRNGETIKSLNLTTKNEHRQVNMWMIDGGYQHDVVQRYVREVGRELPFQVAVSRGYPADRYRPSGKNVIGAPREMCHMTKTSMGPFVAFNQHYWTEISQRAWTGSIGAPGSLSLFDGRGHTEFAEHQCKDRLTEKIEGKSGTIWRYNRQPGRNDWGDAVYGCYVAAALLGVGSQGIEKPKPKLKRRRVRHVPV
jgi:hypothetical protein